MPPFNQNMTNKITISPNSAELPSNVISNTVIRLIGIIKFNGAIIKLYPYNKNIVNTTFRINVNIFFNNLSTSL